MKLYKKGIHLLFVFVVTFLVGCTAVQTKEKVVAGEPNEYIISRLGKSDINEVVEYHQRAVIQDLKLLMLKLYRRNPKGRHDVKLRSIEASVELFFSKPHNHDTGHKQWESVKSDDIIRISLDEKFEGEDRVLPFIFGLRKMLMGSYGDRVEFFYLTKIDEQKLYNSARNIEIAAWMLAERKGAQGEPLLLSDSLEYEKRNLSYQRIIGRMIATQDNVAGIISHKSGRLIKTIVVRVASMMFLPI